MRKDSTPCFPSWRHVLGPMGPRVQDAFKGVQALTLSRLEERLRPYLPAPLLQATGSGANSRERIFPLPRTCLCWIWQMLQFNTSCREVVRQVQALFALQGGRTVDEDSSAYCQARARVPNQRLQQALATTAVKARQQAPTLQLLQGRPLKAVDGTGVRAADTPANQQRYPQPPNQKPGCGFPVLRVVVLFCMTSGAVLAHCTGSLFQAEVSLFYQLFGSLKPGDIMVGDRGFGHFVVLALLARMGVDGIARVPTGSRRVDWRQGQSLGEGDLSASVAQARVCGALDPRKALEALGQNHDRAPGAHSRYGQGLSNQRDHPGDHPSGCQPLSQKRDPGRLPATVAPGNVPQGFEIHPGLERTQMPDPTDGRKGTLSRALIAQFAALHHGPSSSDPRCGSGADQL